SSPRSRFAYRGRASITAFAFASAAAIAFGCSRTTLEPELDEYCGIAIALFSIAVASTLLEAMGGDELVLSRSPDIMSCSLGMWGAIRRANIATPRVVPGASACGYRTGSVNR